MTFTPNIAARNQGRRGHFGYAPQAEPGVYVPPTLFLRETTGSGFLPDVVESVSQAFRGSAFEPMGEYAGSDYQGRSVTGDATIADLMQLSQLLLVGAPDAQGVITPNDAVQWADYLPNPAFSAQWYVPGAGHVQITDGQLHELTITVPEQRNEYVTAALGFHATKAIRHPQGAPIAPFTPAVPVIPAFTGGLRRLEHSVTVAGVAYTPDSTSVARLFNPVEPLPSSGEYISGFTPGDQPIGAEFQFATGRPEEALLALGAARGFAQVVWKLQASATKLFTVTAQCQVTMREAPVAPGRVRTNFTLRARQQTPGVAPFTVTVKNT